MNVVQTAFDRSAKALALRPSLGRGTGVSRTRIHKGLTCQIEDGPWKLTADMPTSVGGDGSAPTPGVYGRAALGSCLAIGYMLWAAKLDVPIAAIDVQVEADYDDGALFGVSDSPPGYLEVRYTVTVETNAPDSDVQRVLDEGDAHSPYLDVFRRAQTCRREVRLVSSRRRDGSSTSTTCSALRLGQGRALL
jgi:uncharacterized OsmC-like protein